MNPPRCDERLSQKHRNLLVHRPEPHTSRQQGLVEGRDCYLTAQGLRSLPDAQRLLRMFVVRPMSSCYMSFRICVDG